MINYDNNIRPAWLLLLTQHTKQQRRIVKEVNAIWLHLLLHAQSRRVAGIAK